MVWLKRILGLISCGSLQWRWLRFDVIQDLLDYVWVSDVGDDAHGATTQWAQANIKPIAARSKTRLSGSPLRR